MVGMSHDDVFVSSSMGSSITPGSTRINPHHLALITQALPEADSEYRKRLAAATSDAKEQHVTDFLR